MNQKLRMSEQILVNKKETESGIIKMSRNVALISFVIGTLILLTFYLSENIGFAFIGLFYLFVATVINLIFLIGLIMKLIKKESDRRKTWISIGILLANIPIVILYYNIAIYIIGTIAD
jgi:hypothetical protein